MAVNRFDQASRYLAKRDPVGFLSWQLHEAAAVLHFQGWLDTRTLPFPGEPDRTCDTVAWLGDETPGVHWAVPVEFCLEPDGAMFGRLLVYLGQLWLEHRPSDGRGSRFHVAAVVVNLTGLGHTSRELVLRQTGGRTCLQVVECNLARLDAHDTLAEIEAGKLRRCVLPWIPLMQGGNEAAIIERWLVLAGAELNAHLRADYGGLAVVLADAAGRRPIWKEALKEWNMRESQAVLEWMNEAEIKRQVADLLRLLELRLPPGVPPELVDIIRQTTDRDQLSRWFDAAATAPSLDAFRRAAGL